MLCTDWLQRNLLVLIGRCGDFLLSGYTPALDARNWIEHCSADNDTNSHHVERVVVAV